jgi:hypothetical protein
MYKNKNIHLTPEGKDFFQIATYVLFGALALIFMFLMTFLLSFIAGYFYQPPY